MLTFQGLDRVQTTEAGPGDIVLVNGIENIGIGVTLTDPLNPMPLPMLPDLKRKEEERRRSAYAVPSAPGAAPSAEDRACPERSGDRDDDPFIAGVSSYLQAQGVAATRIQTISFGKDKPLDMGHDEAAWARNRNAFSNIIVEAIS